MVAFILFFICVNILGYKAELSFVDPNDVSDPSLLLTISDGEVYGRKSTTVGQGITYYSFRGIPYAKPPLGNLRFEPPQKNEKWNGTLDCTEDRSQCIQQLFTPITGSEDCLYINVYTTNLTGNLPVMVWIYGGGFVIGNSSYHHYGSDYLLEEGVVFVSMNYRVGITGFLSTGDLAAPGNAGLKDQVLALQWVKNNIAIFGGNPDKVTLFGQSAGSASVSYLLQSPKTTNLFHGAIMQSGTSLDLWTLSRKARDAAFKIGQSLGISTLNSTQLVQQLKLVDARDLLTAASEAHISLFLGNALEGLVLAPVIEPEHDGALFSARSYHLLSEGNFQTVPCIIGFTSNEAASAEELIGLLRLYIAITYDINNQDLTPADLSNNFLTRSAAGIRIKQQYVGLLTPFSLAPATKITSFLNDDQFIRGVREAVLQQSKYSNVYMYEFSYFGYLGFQGTRSAIGVGHAEDLGYIFRKYVNDSLVTPADQLTRARTIRMWTNFAKYGNPTPTQEALLQNVIWTVAGTNRNDLNFLNINNTLVMQKNPYKQTMNFYDDIYEDFGDDNYDTY